MAVGASISGALVTRHPPSPVAAHTAKLSGRRAPGSCHAIPGLSHPRPSSAAADSSETHAGLPSGEITGDMSPHSPYAAAASASASAAAGAKSAGRAAFRKWLSAGPRPAGARRRGERRGPAPAARTPGGPPIFFAEGPPLRLSERPENFRIGRPAGSRRSVLRFWNSAPAGVSYIMGWSGHSANMSDEALAEILSILKENNSLLKANHEYLKENNSLLKENDSLLKENDTFLRENNAFLKENNGLLKENNAILKNKSC